MALLRSSDRLMRILGTVRDACVPEGWVGAGVLRDLVWGSVPRDVDVAFFDPSDLSRANDIRTTDLLTRWMDDVPWEAKNQAAVHTWYADRFGGDPVEPLVSIDDAVGTLAAQSQADQRRAVAGAAGAAPAADTLAPRDGRRVRVETAC